MADQKARKPGGDPASSKTPTSGSKRGRSDGSGRRRKLPSDECKPRVVAQYEYTDEQGDRLFRVTRLEPGEDGAAKTFRQSRWDGNRYRSGLGDARKVLYHLPQVVEAVAAGEVIYITEGEKDADTLTALGVVATCNPMGAGRGKWRPEYSDSLRGAHVRIVVDNDVSGYEHGIEVYESLDGVAASVGLFRPEKGCNDITDQVDAHWHEPDSALDHLQPTTVDKLRHLVAQHDAQRGTQAATSKPRRSEDRQVIPRGLILVLGVLTASGYGPNTVPDDLTQDINVRCPVHDDRTPSATLRIGSDRPVVFHCHRGCSQDDFLEWCRKAGVSNADLMDGSNPFADGSSWLPVELGAVLTGDIERELPTIGQRDDGVCLIYPGKLHSIAGEPEAAKSMLVQLIAVQELQTGNHVVYVDYEDSAASVVGRLLDLGATAEQIAVRFHYLRPDEPFAAGVQHVEAMLRAHQPTLIVLDGVTEAMTVEGKSPMDMVEVAVFLQTVARRLVNLSGAAYVQIDHVTKSRDGRAQWAIGSQHKLAGLDGAAYTMEKVRPFVRGQGGRSKINIAKDRPGWVKPGTAGGTLVGYLDMFPDPNVPDRFVAKVTSPSQADVEEVVGPAAGVELRIVRALMEDLPDEEMQKSRVKKRVGGKGTTFDEVWKALADEGGIRPEMVELPNALGAKRKVEIWRLA